MKYASKYVPLRPNGAMTDTLKSAENIVLCLARATSTEEISDALEQFARQFGLSMTGHVTLFDDTPAHSISYTMNDELPNYWDDYNSLNCFECDGILWQAQHQFLPIPWGFADQRAIMDSREKRLYSLADDYGIFQGAMVPIHGPHGFSALGTATTEDEAGFRKRLPEFGMIAQLVGIYLNEAVHRICLVTPKKDIPKLSPREKECLAWAAAGKTAWEISQILNVSEATAIFHTANAKRKLNTKALPQAIARAVAMGLISV